MSNEGRNINNRCLWHPRFSKTPDVDEASRESSSAKRKGNSPTNSTRGYKNQKTFLIASWVWGFNEWRNNLHFHCKTTNLLNQMQRNKATINNAMKTWFLNQKKKGLEVSLLHPHHKRSTREIYRRPPFSCTSTTIIQQMNQTCINQPCTEESICNKILINQPSQAETKVFAVKVAGPEVILSTARW